MVFVDRAPRGLSGVYVIEDDLGGAREAVRTWPATATGGWPSSVSPTPVMTTRRRLKGYRAAVAENGLDDRPDLVCMPGGVTRGIRRQAGRAPDGSRTPPRPYSPRTSRARWRSSWPCTRRGAPTSPWSGSATSRMAAALAPAITVIDQDPAGLGRIAVERLLQRIEDPGAPRAPQDRPPGPADPARIGRAASACRARREEDHERARARAAGSRAAGNRAVAPRRSQPADRVRPGGRAARRRLRVARHSTAASTRRSPARCTSTRA